MEKIIFKRPVVLGLSGGADSIYLFHKLLEQKEKRAFDLHIAHIDHGWRAESSLEAKILSELAKNHGCPFHLCKLEKEEGGNLEDKARQKRYEFFEAIYCKYECEALLLAHHADDVVETILKRLFEGAYWNRLPTMQKTTYYGGMKIVRPLVEKRKEEIVDYLKARNIPYFCDATNDDERFLRARMRKKLIPLLEGHFGKSIHANLLRFAKEMTDLDQFMKKRVLAAQEMMSDVPEGKLWDVSSCALDDVEHRFLLKELCKEQGLVLSRSELDSAVRALAKEGGKYVALRKGRQLRIDRKKIYIV